MAKVTGPLFSMSASGTVGNAITFSTWKGIAYVREYFIPANPRSVKQTNLRTAMAILVADWQGMIAGNKGEWDTAAAGTGKSGFNFFVERGLKSYVAQLTVDVTPLSESYVGVPPAETFTWLPVV